MVSARYSPNRGSFGGSKLALFLALTIVLPGLAGCGQSGPGGGPTVGTVGSPTASPTTSPAAGPKAGPRTVFVHLFEWKWPDIAQECETFLGPKGYAAVQVSPPEEHIVASGNPWWERYQPVSYKLESRSGNRAQFADMVKHCKAAGVDIYVDAIINHMAGVDSGTGIAGSSFTHYNYPGLYENNDFHHCGRNSNDDIISYQDRVEVQTCELVNLADLDTGSSHVQDRIAGYLNDLLSLGVTGFRIDAAKHIDTNELKTILGKLNKRSDGQEPYVYQEVIEGADEPIKASEYTQNDDVTEFKYGALLSPVFRASQLANLEKFGTASVFLPSDKAIVFTDNHDNQRGHGAGGDVLTFKDGELYHLANVYMLAWPYGYPEVMSSYDFTNSDQGPPSNADGSTTTIYSNGVPDCGKGRWVCEHRWPDIAGMVGFRDYTALRFEVTDWWSNGNNAIAFGRGDRGFVVINREDKELKNTFKSSMPAGTYCDVTKGDLNPDGQGCTGPIVTVDGTGRITLTVPPMTAVAIHGGARVSDK
ncbi:MAG: alpha-amylase [Chloroflexia bacterium]